MVHLPLELEAGLIILGQHYTVEAISDADEGLGNAPNGGIALGLTHQTRHRIRIRTDASISEDEARDTLLHEVIHVIARLADVQWKERDIRLFATVLLDTLRRNPALVEALLA